MSRGVIISLPVKTMIALLNAKMAYRFCVYHIGVGSSVVCSTVSGNAKASVRGTGNRMVPTLFYLLYLTLFNMLLMGNAEHNKKKMNTIGLLYDILTYSAGCLVVGLVVTFLLVGLLFFIVKGFFPKSTFSPLSIVVGVVLTFFLGYRMITMCGAISLKWMCDDFETYINSIIPEEMLMEAVPLSKSDTDMITDKALHEFPILSQFVSGGTFIGHDTSNIAHTMAATLNEFLNQFIWQSLLWSIAYLIIAAALVVWTLKKQWDYRLSSSGKHASGCTTNSSGRYSRMSHTPRGHSRSSRYRH